MAINHKDVQEYYGKTLQKSQDLKTNACCTFVEYPQSIKSILSIIHDEVMAKYYGCGLTIPHKLEGLKLLDLGSGSGRDSFLASKLVGGNGYVVGVDMTDEQLDVANKHVDYHMEKFGFTEKNIEFKKGTIESLDEIGLKENTFDVIISNCVINLSLNKEKVLRDCYSLLKEGGEMYFSDVYVNRRVPSELVNDPILYGECLSGALYWNDFENLARKVGFTDPRSVEASRITIENKEVLAKLEGYEFYSVTYRLFKLEGLEPDCEDYGQAVIYRGGIENAESAFRLDNGHLFEKGRAVSVCGNTFLMLQKTRFRDHFEFIGNFEKHFGIFPGCGTDNPYANLGLEGKNQQAQSCC